MVESPTKMDFETREQGKEMHEVLKLFKTTTTSPMSSCILQMPKHKRRIVEDSPKSVQGTQRRSPRLSAKKKPTGKSIVRLAKEFVAKKCGIAQEDEPLDDMILQQYMSMYKEPLSDSSMAVILKLTKVTEEKKNKAKKESKKEKAKEGSKAIGGKLKKKAHAGALA
jgi:hypothetical protein